MTRPAHSPEPRAAYVTDVPYARTFNDHLAPSTLALVAALNGVVAPPTDAFDYCELGCGHGDTTATLAAANPHARFVGVDFNAEHVRFARELATHGRLDNARFVECDFEALAAQPLPSFDYIALHGVMSWVSAAKRQAILAFANAKLKPGGLLYASYNALPGWAALAPLRALMLAHTEHMTGTTLERAREGVRFAQQLADAGAVYFASHPTAQSMLAVMQRAGLRYVVHEYFNQHWEPMSFGDVAREMEDHDLHYVGQLPLYLNFRELALPARLREAAAGLDDRLAFERAKDFALNEFFRSDVYVKAGAPPHASTRSRTGLEATPFGTLAPSSLVRRAVQLPHYSMQFSGALYDAVLAEIAEGSATAADLAARPALASFGVTRVGDALQSLALGGQVVPLRASVLAPTQPATSSARHRVPLPFNRVVLQRPLANDTPIVVASPAAGTGLALSMLDATCIRLLTEVEPAQRGRWIDAFVAGHPLQLAVEQQRVKDPVALARTIADAFELFCAQQWPRKLVELGVLAAVEDGADASGSPGSC